MLLIGTGRVLEVYTVGFLFLYFTEVSSKSVRQSGEENEVSKEMQELEVIPDLPGSIFHRCRLQSCNGTIQMQAKVKLIRVGAWGMRYWCMCHFFWRKTDAESFPGSVLRNL